jgi:CxxC motif-containing protein
MPEIICIGCPLGCRVMLKIGSDSQIENIVGNRCKEGKKYVTAEFQNPVRFFTSTILVEGSRRLLSVRTSKPVPKNRLKDLARFVAQIKVKSPVEMGQEIVHDILGTGTNLMSTGTLQHEDDCT